MKPIAVICDIDGTLAHMVNRGPYDPTKYLDDVRDDLVAWAFDALSVGAVRIIMSGRDEDYRADTELWLKRNEIEFDQLYMRPSGDKRNDAIVKQELYEAHVKDVYDVRCVLDDRNRVVDMWRANGLKVLQVADGDF